MKQQKTADGVFIKINKSLYGRNTGMYYHFGGDDTAIKDDKVYLRFLDLIQTKGGDNE